MKFKPYKISVKTQEMHDFLRNLTLLQATFGPPKRRKLNQGLINALDNEEVK